MMVTTIVGTSSAVQSFFIPTPFAKDQTTRRIEVWAGNGGRDSTSDQLDFQSCVAVDGHVSCVWLVAVLGHIDDESVAVIEQARRITANRNAEEPIAVS